MCLGHVVIGGVAIRLGCRMLVGECAWAVCGRVARLPHVMGVCWVCCGVGFGWLVGVADW